MVTIATDLPIRLRITEIFHSLQGETSTVGLPTVFVRLTGCPLRCQYCDTAYAFNGGEMMGLSAVLDRVASYQTRHVTVTGGEPLAQPACLALLKALCDAGYETSLETSGALDIGSVDARVARIVDLKTPGSGEEARNRWENVDLLTRRDQIKFVICDANDYTWARDVAQKYDLSGARGRGVVFAELYRIAGGTTCQWILRDRLPVRMQIQLHKVLWGNEPGR